MAQGDLARATTTDFINKVSNYSVDSKPLDKPSTGHDDETYWYFNDAAQNFGYLKSNPELAGGVDLLSIWVAGKGYEADQITRVELNHITGWGEDTFQSIMQGMIVVKKVIGDAFCEIVKDDETKMLINLMPISPERVRIVITPKGRIKRYDVFRKGEWVGIATKKMLHLSNNRIADETHGNSMMNVCKWTLDALQEAYDIKRMLINRSKALGIAYYETNDAGKITYANTQIEKAVKNGEMLGLPKGVMEIKEFPKQNILDIMEWIRHLENRIYIAMKVPRVMATSEGYTEAGGQVGFLTFEPIYTSEQTLLEDDLWNQLVIRVKFNKPPSLDKPMQETQQKNGPPGIQPNDVEASIEQG